MLVYLDYMYLQHMQSLKKTQLGNNILLVIDILYLLIRLLELM